MQRARKNTKTFGPCGININIELLIVVSRGYLKPEFDLSLLNHHISLNRGCFFQNRMIGPTFEMLVFFATCWQFIVEVVFSFYLVPLAYFMPGVIDIQLLQTHRFYGLMILG